MPITYPRPCPTCGAKLKNQSAFSRHRKYCGRKTDPVACPYCESTFKRKDDLSKYTRKFHSELAKREANDTVELHADKVPRLSDEHQTGGVVTTRDMKRETTEEECKHVVKASKPEEADSTPTTSDEYGGGPNPLFVADVKKLEPAKRWKQNAVVNQKFIFTLDQQRGPKDGEDLNNGATHALAVATGNLIEEMKIPEDYWMTLQIASREHRQEGLTGETWKLPVDDFTKRPLYTQSVLQKLSNVLNSGQFITNDIGFSASVLFTRPEGKGGKRAGGGPSTRSAKPVNTTPLKISRKIGEEFAAVERSQEAPCRSTCQRGSM